MINISNITSGFIALCGLVIFSGCQKAGSKELTKDIPTSKAEPVNLEEWAETNSSLIEAEQNFAFKFLQSMQEESIERNQLISPLSLQIALGMLWNGAKTGTADSMAAALGWTGMSPEHVSKQMVWLQTALLNADSKIKLEIANAIFTDTVFVPEPEFLSQNKDSYNAKIQSLNFSKSKETLDIINGWSNEKTHGKIPKVIGEINPSMKMALCNAVYFKGEWSLKFSSSMTVSGIFNLYSSVKNSQPIHKRTTKAAYLQRNDKMDYAEDSLAQWALIPYGDSLFSMVVALPKAGTSLLEFTKSLTSESWNRSLTKLGPCYIKFFMPKHKIEVSYEKEIESVLTKMGMGVSFGNKADFSGITKAQPFFIGTVVHKSFIEIDEKGSEAAAVTVSRARGGGPPTQPKPIPVLRLNRPYLYAIVEKKTRTILFLGAMNNPNPKEEPR